MILMVYIFKTTGDAIDSIDDGKQNRLIVRQFDCGDHQFKFSLPLICLVHILHFFLW